MSTPKSAALTERQLDLITRAHLDSNGLIEPLLKLKGGAKLKMIASLSQRGMIAQVGGQWRITPTAQSIVKGEAPTMTPISPLSPPSPISPILPSVTEVSSRDPEIEAAAQHPLQVGVEGKPRVRESKQATVIEMLKHPGGTTIAQVCEATGWLPHTVRGTFAGAIKKKLGLTITSTKEQGSERTYRIAPAN